MTYKNAFVPCLNHINYTNYMDIEIELCHELFYRIRFLCYLLITLFIWCSVIPFQKDGITDLPKKIFWPPELPNQSVKDFLNRFESSFILLR